MSDATEAVGGLIGDRIPVTATSSQLKRLIDAYQIAANREFDRVFGTTPRDTWTTLVQPGGPLTLEDLFREAIREATLSGQLALEAELDVVFPR